MSVWHVVAVVTGELLIFIGAFIGSTDKEDKKLKLHMSLGVIGFLLFLIGAISLLLTGRIHVNLPHFYLGLLTVVFIILAAIGGIVYTKAESTKKQGFRKSHKAVSLIALLLLVVTIVFGIIGIKALK